MSKHKLIPALLIILTLIPLSGFGPPRQEEGARVRVTQIDTSDFPQVTVYVAVEDADGEPLGVDPARIQLLENDQVIPVEQIEGAGEIEPLTVLLAMDISGSMLYVGKLDAAKQAAVLFVEGLRPSDRVGLLTFHSEIDYVQPITADHQLVINAIKKLEAAEDTAMYDALAEAIDILSEVKGRKAVVVITDGLDTLSQETPESVLEKIGPSGLSISTIGLGDPDQDLAEKTALDVDALTYLAENAGGVYRYANDQDSLSEIYQEYAVAYKSEYQLTYTSPSALRDGVNRALSVRLADAPASAASEGTEPIVYNPGGLVPEVSDPVPLPFFGLLLLGLTVLLFVPAGVRLVKKAAVQEKPEELPEKPKPRIKLKD
ncbi:MAG: vWA domain-containing protein [Anaerolineales bacterium]